jgi:hypothetical protein
MTEKQYQLQFNKSELVILVRVLRDELLARQRWLDITSTGRSYRGRPPMPSIKYQRQQYIRLSKIYRKLREIEKQ